MMATVFVAETFGDGIVVVVVTRHISFDNGIADGFVVALDASK